MDPEIELVPSDSAFDSLSPPSWFELFILDPLGPLDEFDPDFPYLISLLLVVMIEMWLARASASNNILGFFNFSVIISSIFLR